MKTFAAEIIDALGGTTTVAREIKAPISTVHSWRQGKIPDSRLEHLRLLAKAKKVVLPEQDNDHTPECA